MGHVCVRASVCVCEECLARTDRQSLRASANSSNTSGTDLQELTEVLCLRPSVDSAVTQMKKPVASTTANRPITDGQTVSEDMSARLSVCPMADIRQLSPEINFWVRTSAGGHEMMSRGSEDT